LLIKPGRTIDEVGQGAPRKRAAVGGEMTAKEIDAARDPADDGLGGMLLQPQRAEDCVHQPHGAAQLPSYWRQNQDVVHEADTE